MPPRPVGRQLGLFDNPVRAFSLEELAETVRKLERQRPGRTVEELSRAVFADLAMKRTRRAADLVAEAIRIARERQPHAEIAGSQWQASTSEVRQWAAGNGFQIGSDGTIPEQAITAYNQTHPDRPYLPQPRHLRHISATQRVPAGMGIQRHLSSYPFTSRRHGYARLIQASRRR